MVIQHNMWAANTSRMCGVASNQKSKSMKKLSSGYKINIAADDAAGLTISEKMRSQIRGLSKASDNVQEGISLIQVADGALNETHAILQRMRELAVQAANDINSDSDRADIQFEIDALTEEIDRIANTTTFNEGIYPLAGGNVEETTEVYPFMLDGNVTQHTYTLTNMADDGLPQTFNGIEYQYGETATLTALSFYNPNTGIATNILDGAISYNSAGSPPVSSNIVGHYYDGSYNLKLSDLKTNAAGYVYYTSKRDGVDYYLYLRTQHNDIVYTREFDS